MPNGTSAPGKTQPVPNVPIIGSTYCATFAACAVAGRVRQASRATKMRRTPGTTPGGAASCGLLLAGRGRPAAGELLADLQAEALEQPGHRLGLHLQAEALVELRQLLRVGLDR